MNHPNSNLPLIPVILCGGKGSRLWPLSRGCHPKQYLYLDDKSKYTLLQNTYLRLIGIEGLKNPLIICNEEQRFLVAEQMREIDIKPESILLEPFGKNTGPAITLAAQYGLQNYDDPLLLILSADHIINNKSEFQKTIQMGVISANQGDIVTFGINASSPETGFGYIEAEEELTRNNPSSKIKGFIEKPSKEKAQKLILNNKFSWNSGIFLAKSSTLLKEIKKYHPEMVTACKNSLLETDISFNFKRIDKDRFEKCPNISIDNALMEKTNLGRVFLLDASWSDIGSWKSVWENAEKDLDGNYSKGKILFKNSKNCYFRSENRLVVGLGLKDTVVIETSDAILVSKNDSTQLVKEIVKELDKNNFPEASINKKMYRPWGSYTGVSDGDNWQVKKIEVNPNASLSLQLHNHRAEHWIVVKGMAKVEIDNKESLLKKNQSIYVPIGSKHRITNPDKEIALILIEVQSGNYLGEDDIIRFDDKYGRLT